MLLAKNRFVCALRVHLAHEKASYFQKETHKHTQEGTRRRTTTTTSEHNSTTTTTNGVTVLLPQRRIRIAPPCNAPSLSGAKFPLSAVWPLGPNGKPQGKRVQQSNRPVLRLRRKQQMETSAPLRRPIVAFSSASELDCLFLLPNRAAFVSGR